MIRKPIFVGTDLAYFLSLNQTGGEGHHGEME